MPNSRVKTQQDLLGAARYLGLTFPASMRQLFAMLAMYDPRQGLGDLLDRFDWDATGVADVQRLLATAKVHLPAREGADARTVLEEGLRSLEFQSEAIPSILNAFPELRRDVFVHIPKCAGTDLSLNLGPQRLTVPKLLEARDWVGPDQMLGALADLARNAPFFGEFFVYGHMNLNEYAARCGVRRGDSIFTILRDPIDLMLSQANFSISRLRQDPEAHDPDTQGIRRLLGLEGTAPLSPAELREVAVRALRDERISQPNLMCRYLGNASSKAADAIASIVEYDIELTETKRYPQWMQERFGIEQSSRHNSSLPLLRRQEMVRLFGAELRERTDEDFRLYTAVTRMLDASGHAAIRGHEIARRAAVQVLAPPPDAGPADPDKARIAAITGNNFAVEVNEALLPQAVTGLMPVIAADVRFGHEGNAVPVQGEGWASGERGFTWAIKGHSTLSVPRPRIAATYLLTAKLSPFVTPAKLPQQTVRVSVNGRQVGEVTLSKPSLIECELPWSWLDGADAVSIAFAFPDAARPTEVGASDKDERLLGAAFFWLRLATYLKADTPAD